MATPQEKTTLAIETAIDGGSMAIFVNGTPIVGRSLSNIGRGAENTLSAIEDALRHTGIEIKMIDHVAVAAGPGSFTGIRIGLATGLGLADSIGSNFSSHSILEAFADSIDDDGMICSMVSMGRGFAASQHFSRSPAGLVAVGDIKLGQIDDLGRLIEQTSDAIACDQNIAAGLEDLGFTVSVMDIPAICIGRLALKRPGETIEPLLLNRI